MATAPDGVLYVSSTASEPNHCTLTTVTTAHHALKRAINFHQRGELRDRTGEGQHYRVAGLNQLAAIIIYWNTVKLGDAVFARKQAGLAIPAELLAHVSPLGWEHINLTGEYRWPGTDRRATRNGLA